MCAPQQHSICLELPLLTYFSDRSYSVCAISVTSELSNDSTGFSFRSGRYFGASRLMRRRQRSAEARVLGTVPYGPVVVLLRDRAAANEAVAVAVVP